jgi:hypothetical protein
MRLGIRPAKAAIDRITSAEDRGCLLIGNLVGNKVPGAKDMLVAGLYLLDGDFG